MSEAPRGPAAPDPQPLSANPHVMTVLGPVALEALGPTLIHEHVLFDLSVYHRLLTAAGEAALPGPLGIEQLHVVRHNMAISLDNSRQRDPGVAAAELARYKEHGGGTVVDVTSDGLEPDPAGLAEAARQSGLNVVAGTGYYLGASHPPGLADKSAEQVADELLRDFEDGFPGTSVRAGVLGEIGTSEPLTPTEQVVLRACGRAQSQIGAAIVLHPDSTHLSYEPIARTLDFLERSGARLDKVVISHCDDRLWRAPEAYPRLAALGPTLAFDTFGKHHFMPSRGRQYPNDATRIELVARLVADGLADRLVLAHDACYKVDLVTWGGDGYAHLPRNILPRLRAAGVSEDAIHRMTVLNPGRLLPLSP